MTDTETALLEQDHLARARNGDQAAFAWLYRQNVNRIYALCLRMTADQSVAEECTQRAFVQAFRRLADFRGDSRWSTWLHRVAVNEVMGSHRDTGRRRLREVPLVDPDLELSPNAENPGATLDLERAIARLPDRARQVFVLIAIHGHSHEEAGELLGVAAGTCKAQYHRARGLLAQWLGVNEGAEHD
ncbi:MAG: RNA polymerase sigma factor [Gammaproteobacteria bacterium]|nr:RNA polymerase sigma factor [Gammaproteobacteria bacterium]